VIDGVKFNGESDSRVCQVNCGGIWTVGKELRARLISDFETTYSTTTSSSI